MMIETKRRPYIVLGDKAASRRGWLVSRCWQEFENVGRRRDLVGVHLVKAKSRWLELVARGRVAIRSRSVHDAQQVLEIRDYRKSN